MKAVIGLFDTNNFRSHCLLRDLEKQFGEVKYIILWDNFIDDSRFDFTQFKHLQQVDKGEILEFISRDYLVDKDLLTQECKRYKPLLKILLVIYCRKLLGLDYCVMIDNDIFIFEPIDEIVKLFFQGIPFFIQETGAADSLPQIAEYITYTLGKRIRYVLPSKGGGYNIGICGLDLSVLDVIDAHNFGSLLEILSDISEWWKDQAFLVPMTFTSETSVYTFERDKYLFLPYNDLCYRAKSKIYHCIYTTDKKMVDYYYLTRYGHYPSRWRGRLALAYAYLPETVRNLVKSVRNKLRIRSRIRSCLGLTTPRGEVLNANRYRHILDWVKGTHCRRILEIGVWRGDTSEVLIRNSSNPHVEYHGIDLFEDSHDDLVREEYSLRAHSMALVQKRLEKTGKRVFLHKGLSKDIYPKLLEDSIKFDLIWIDGGHSYETVKFDFELYSKLLTENGIIFFDDYTEDPYLPDVKRYIDSELLTDSRLEVMVHEKYIDRYRGYDYKVVSIRFKGREPIGEVPSNTE
jgi:predicted O-methyltransferase YrrM